MVLFLLILMINKMCVTRSQNSDNTFLTQFVRQVYMHENCVRKYEGICYE